MKQLFGTALIAVTRRRSTHRMLDVDSDSSVPTTASAVTTESQISGDITVFAAASLKKTFTAIGEQFKKDHPGTNVEFTFAGSSDLVAQLDQGARGTYSPPPTPQR